MGALDASLREIGIADLVNAQEFAELYLFIYSACKKAESLGSAFDDWVADLRPVDGAGVPRRDEPQMRLEKKRQEIVLFSITYAADEKLAALACIVPLHIAIILQHLCRRLKKLLIGERFIEQQREDYSKHLREDRRHF